MGNQHHGSTAQGTRRVQISDHRDRYAHQVDGGNAVVNITQEVAIKFLQITIFRFGIHKWVLIDNGTQFKGAKFAWWCVYFSINHQASSTAHSQTNNQVEHANDLEAKGRN
jgi:hypothetical protein